ncbi:MAG: hypothetical protein Q4A47_05060 [Erysipelotrichaceae bacterium]|nr:hypothetical protein [Erysipelotrichaceae bacterium]
MNNTVLKKELFLDLSINEKESFFSTHINNAIVGAKNELNELKESVESIKKLKPECDYLDYILAASSGALCGIIDIFLVGKPGETPLGKWTDNKFNDAVMAFAKSCGWSPKEGNKNDVANAIGFLEKCFKVPYDQTGMGDSGKIIFGLNAKNHHYKSLAHNPSLLGLFFSILDQFNNTSHFVTDGKLISLEKAKEGWELQGNNVPSKIFCGFVNWFGHLVSDVSGSKSSASEGSRGMGLPSPLWVWINDLIAIKSKLGLTVTETDKSFNELALNIFEKGYDLRFQTTQAIPVLINELIVRFIYSIRRLFKYYIEIPKFNQSLKMIWQNCEPFSNATVKRMLTVAHGTFCLIDIGDATVKSFVSGGGNFNIIEFVLRLNVVGVGRFTISLYGEIKREITYYKASKEYEFANKKMIIISHYIEGLKILSEVYNDKYVLNFVEDFKRSDAYKQGFEKTVKLAKLRKVTEDKILKNKSDIDTYFGGK